MKTATTISVFAFALIASNFAMSPADSKAATTTSAATYTFEFHALRALSIKVLQQQLRTLNGTDKHSKQLLELAGLRRILGFVADRKERDLVLLGWVGDDSPPLHLEDFVVALRNAWLKYAPLEDNTYIYSYPGCSIEPHPDTLRKLRQIGQEITGSSSSTPVEEHLEDWRQTCERQQTVVVTGIPFDTSFALVLVSADYEMKSIADGSIVLDLPGLMSVPDTKLAQIRHVLTQNKKVLLSQASSNRFWFCSGKTLYEQDGDIVIIKQCPVRLLTEEMFVTSKGQLASAGTLDPDAREFAGCFSALYDKVARQQAIYHKLEDLFRIFALAKLIKFCSAHEKASVDLSCLLDDFAVSPNNVPKFLPGKPAIKEFEHRASLPDGYSINNFWLPSCGGVAIDIEPKPEDFVHTSRKLLGRLKEKALGGRKSAADLYWDLGEECADVTEDIKLSQYASNINHSSKNSSALIVAYEGDGYRIYSGTGDLLCRDKHQNKVIQTIVSRMGKDLKDVVHLFLIGFPSKDKIKAFETSARINLSTIRSGIHVRAVNCGDEMPSPMIAFLSPGIRLYEPGAIAKEANIYERDDHLELRLTFLTKIKGRLRRMILCWKSETRGVLERVLSKILAYFPIVPDNESSLLDLLIEIRHELKKDHNLKDEKLDSIIRDELSGMEISVLTIPTNRRAA